MLEAQRIEAYWLPGCSSCLRMKEFLESNGQTFEAINLQESAEGQAKLEKLGVAAPATCIGERCVNGVDLAAVADLVGIKYEPRPMLSPKALVDRYNLNVEAGRRFISQMNDELLAYSIEGRERPMIDVAAQVALVARAFLAAYNDDQHDTKYYKGGRASTKDEVLKLSVETQKLMNDWWEEDGQDDPLDRVTETYWGHPTLHEVLEREVWHTTQHIRQLEDILKRFKVSPDGPLTKANLDGLPLPERIHE